jgi:hypothetical protein
MFQNMIKSNISQILFILFLSLSFTVSAQVENENAELLFYRKKELNTGLLLEGNSDREQLFTNDSRRTEELLTGFAGFKFNSSFLNYLNYKQDELKFDFEVGPFGGFGNWVDSSNVAEVKADHNLVGLRSSVSVDYIQRYYYNSRNYTIVNVNAWARSEWFQQHSTGTSVDSLGVISEIDNKSTETKFRYAIEAKAGWGFGRLSVMNNYMLVQSIVEKYYAGRLFSENEIAMIAKEVATIKDQRDIVNGHNTATEAQVLSDYLNEKLLLTVPEDLLSDWELGEFKPRFHGSRFEIGPFFKFFNQEPDFIYGGYLKYENAKYSSLKWNRNFSAGLKYNRYKIFGSTGTNDNDDDLADYYEGQDWMSAEINIGWSYFPNLKRQFDFGVKYVPGVEVNEFTELGDFNHGVVPYLAYFSQINSKSRINLAFAYRISADEQLMLPGPEFSLSFYRSRY